MFAACALAAKTYLRLLQLLVQNAQRNFCIYAEQPESEQTVGNFLTFAALFGIKATNLYFQIFIFKCVRFEYPDQVLHRTPCKANSKLRYHPASFSTCCWRSLVLLTFHSHEQHGQCGQSKRRRQVQ